MLQIINLNLNFPKVKLGHISHDYGMIKCIGIFYIQNPNI